MKAKSLDKNDVLNAIENCDFYATQGPELHVKRHGDKIIAYCSECEALAFMSNRAWAPDRMKRGNVTYAEYQLTDVEKWIRVEVKDKNGLYAWSNVLFL